MDAEEESVTKKILYDIFIPCDWPETVNTQVRADPYVIQLLHVSQIKIYSSVHRRYISMRARFFVIIIIRYIVYRSTHLVPVSYRFRDP